MLSLGILSLGLSLKPHKRSQIPGVCLTWGIKNVNFIFLEQPTALLRFQHRRLNKKEPGTHVFLKSPFVFPASPAARPINVRKTIVDFTRTPTPTPHPPDNFKS
jgi:hypothetical protein